MPNASFLTSKCLTTNSALLGCEPHWRSRVKRSESKLTPFRIEKATGGKITSRSVNTVKKLAGKVSLR